METLVTIDSVSRTAGEWMVNLVEVDGARALLIRVSAADGALILSHLMETDSPRPSDYYDQLVAAIVKAGGIIDRAVIAEEVEKTYHAYVVVKRDNTEGLMCA